MCTVRGMARVRRLARGDEVDSEMAVHHALRRGLRDVPPASGTRGEARFPGATAWFVGLTLALSRADVFWPLWGDVGSRVSVWREVVGALSDVRC